MLCGLVLQGVKMSYRVLFGFMGFWGVARITPGSCETPRISDLTSNIEVVIDTKQYYIYIMYIYISALGTLNPKPDPQTHPGCDLSFQSTEVVGPGFRLTFPPVPFRESPTAA